MFVRGGEGSFWRSQRSRGLRISLLFLPQIFLNISAAPLKKSCRTKLETESDSFWEFPKMSQKTQKAEDPQRAQHLESCLSVTSFSLYIDGEPGNILFFISFQNTQFFPQVLPFYSITKKKNIARVWNCPDITIY